MIPPTFEYIDTPRLTIRRFEWEDWQAVYAYASNAAVMRFIPGGALSEVQAREFVKKQLGPECEDLAVVLKDEGRLIGHMNFHPWFAPNTYEIGWVFHLAYQGRGYATEAAQALLRYGFETLRSHRFIATCQPENPASFRVMEKLGMRREGHFRECILRPDGTWWDEYFYAILADEWAPDLTK